MTDRHTGAALRIGRNMAALVTSRVLGLALALVQYGIIFRALSLEGRGQLGFGLSYAALFGVFATFGVQRLLVRDIARDPASAWPLAWTAGALVTVLSALTALLVAATLVLGGADRATVNAALLASLSVVIVPALQKPFESLLTARERMGWVGLAALVAAVTRVGLVWAAMAVEPAVGMALLALAGGNAAGLLVLAGASVAVAGWERPRTRLAHVLGQMRECVPFAVAMVFSLVYFKSDMAILKFMAGDAAAGVYTPVQRLMEPLLMVAGIWGTVVFPALCRFAAVDDAQYARLRRSAARLALLGALPMAFGLAVLAEPVTRLLVGGDAEGAAETAALMRLYCAVVPFFYLNGVAQEFLYAVHQNWRVVAAYAGAAVVSVAGNLALIPALGPSAVAYAAVAANALISVVFVWSMRDAYGAMGLPSLTAKTAVASAGMALAAWAGARVNLGVAVAAGAVVYVALQWALGVLDPEERRLVRQLARRR